MEKDWQNKTWHQSGSQVQGQMHYQWSFYYALVGGAPEAYGSHRVCVCLSVFVYVFHAHFSATAKN